jgi:serine/threonine-protein kinase
MIVPDPHMPQGERTKLLDFGIAKFTGDKDLGTSLQTLASVVMGSVTYMSPEQCRGAAYVDDRTDVYAMGCMLFEMLAGRPPFSGSSMAEVMGKQQFEIPPPLGKVASGVPASLSSLVERLLGKEKAQRPPMSQVLEGLEILREQLPRVMQRRSARLPMLRPVNSLSPARFASTLGHSVGQGLQRLRARSSWLLIAGTAAMLGLGGLITYERLAHRHQPPGAPAVAASTPSPTALPPAAPAPAPAPAPAADPASAPQAEAATPPARSGHHRSKPEAAGKKRRRHRGRAPAGAVT